MSGEQKAIDAAGGFVSGLFEEAGWAIKLEPGEARDGMVILRLPRNARPLAGDPELSEAVALLASQACGRVTGDRWRCVFDVGGSLAKREALVESLAGELADVVERTGRRVIVEQLGATERKVVHTALLEDGRVSTRSEGPEDRRALIVEPA